MPKNPNNCRDKSCGSPECNKCHPGSALGSPAQLAWADAKDEALESKAEGRRDEG